MIKKIISISAIVLAFSVFQSPVALADHCGCDKDSHKMHKFVEKLDLSKEQKDKVKEIVEQSKDAAKLKHNEMHDVRMLINAAYADGSMTEKKLHEFINKQQQTAGELIKIRMMERFELSKVMTTEQKDKINKMMNQWMMDHKDKEKCSHKDSK